MEERKIDLVVPIKRTILEKGHQKLRYWRYQRQGQHLPSFVNGCQMFRSLLNEGNQDETHEIIRHAPGVDNMFDFLDQEDGRHANAGKGHRYGY